MAFRGVFRRSTKSGCARRANCAFLTTTHRVDRRSRPVESITALGTMLAALLSPGREWGTNPAQLRSIVRRAMAPADRLAAFDSNAAPFVSIGDFLRALDDFAPSDRTTDLRPLFERWHTTTAAQVTTPVGAAADPPLRRSVSMSTAVPMSLQRRPSHDLAQDHRPT